MKRFDIETPISNQLGQSQRQELRSPFRQPTPQADWVTPLLQALTIAIMFALLFGGVMLMAGERLVNVAKVTLATFLLLCPILFILLLNRAYRSIYHVLTHEPHQKEEETRPIVASNRGQFRNPQEAPASVKDATEDLISKCPWQKNTMRWFVWWCDKKGTGHEIWEKPLGRKRYVHWRDSLITAGWAEWNSYGPDGKPAVTQGWRLLTSADVICENIEQ